MVVIEKTDKSLLSADVVILRNILIPAYILPSTVSKFLLSDEMSIRADLPVYVWLSLGASGGRRLGVN